MLNAILLTGFISFSTGLLFGTILGAVSLSKKITLPLKPPVPPPCKRLNPIPVPARPRPKQTAIEIKVTIEKGDIV